MRVFKQFHGTIIGKGGNTLRKVREGLCECAKKRWIEGEKEGGKREGCTLSLSLHLSLPPSIFLPFPPSISPSLLPSRRPSQIREDTDTKIDLPAESSSSDVIVITGRKENVQKAKDRIREIEREMVGTCFYL